jgi:4-amino-4-deoxy-L-arabinose transferase
MRFMAAWVIAPITLLSFSSGKLPTYVLPLFAPVAVLVAIGLLRARASERVMPDRLAVFARTLVRIAAVAAFIIAIAGGRRFGIPVLWESGESLRFTYIGAALLLWAQLDVWSWKATDPRTWLLRTALAPAPVLLAIQFLYPEAALTAVKHPWPLLQRHAEELRSANVLVTSAAPAHALSWVTGRRDFVIAGSPGEFDNELNLPHEESRKIAWSEVAAKVLATKALAPAQSIAVLGSTHELERLAQTPGLPAADSSESVGSVTIMYWR